MSTAHSIHQSRPTVKLTSGLAQRLCYDFLGISFGIRRSAGIEAVSTAANEKKAEAMIALVQRAVVRLSQGATPEQAAREAQPAPPTQKLAGKRGTPADRCRRAYRRGMTWKQLMLAAQVSESTAKRYAKQFDKEMSA